MADYTPATFAAALLGRLGSPVTAQNVQALTAWMKAEGGNWNNSARFNPMNTTQNMPGSTTMNSVGVRRYTSWAQGLDATVQTLQNGRYGGILSALKAGNNANAVVSAVTASPWGTGAFSAGLGSSAVPTATKAATGSDFANTGTDFNTGNGPMSVEEAINQYGFVGTLANSVPELKNILVQAAREDWTTDRFTQKVQDSHWWKSSNETARENTALKATDPAEYKMRLNGIGDHVKSLVLQSGMPLDPKEMNQLVTAAFNRGWTDDRIQEYISSHGQLSGHGQEGVYSAQLKEAAANYGIRFTKDGIGSAVRSIMAGHTSVDAYAQHYRAQAMSAFPLWAKQIEAGQTVRQVADPYIQTMSQLLEEPSTKLDVFDPTIRKALQSTDPDASSPAALPMWKFEQQVRNDPRWQWTDNAKNSAFQVVHQIGADFGFDT